MNLISPIDCNTGYGITGYNIWKYLFAKNHDLCLFPIGNISPEKIWHINNLQKSAYSNKLNFDGSQPCLKVWHDNDFFTKPVGNGLYGGLSFFEIDKVSDISKKSYSLLDIIFVPSQWAKDILIQNGLKSSNIVVCPQGVDTSIFNNETLEDKNDTYVFINIGKWEIRKGHDLIPDLFSKAFSQDDNVELWMVNHNPFLNRDQTNEWIKFYQQSLLSDKIRFFPRLSTQQELSRIMSYSDCGLFPSRGEGWNNEAIELMAKNKPIIITNYSAHTEYCKSNNAYLIDINNTIPAYDNIWFNGEGNWADFDQNASDQTIEHMRYVYKNNIRSNLPGLETATSYSWEKTANIISENLGVN